MRRRRAFTLIEMLLAAMLAALLMGGVLFMAGGIARDRGRIERARGAERPMLVIDQVRWDLTNAATMTPMGNGRGVVLEGHGGIDLRTLRPNGRLARVTYEVRGRRGVEALFREQEYLDDPARPERWTELVAQGVGAISVVAESGDGGPVEQASRARPVEDEGAQGAMVDEKTIPRSFYVPSRARVRIQRSAGSIEEEMWLR